MSGSLHTWYSWHDLERLARRHGLLEGSLRLDRLSRLATLLSSAEGTVNARLSFERDAGGHVAMNVEYAARMTLVCQRCLENLPHAVDGDVRFVVIEDDSGRAGVPESAELLDLNGDRFNPAEFIEDELIVSLPLVSRHASAEECGELARTLERIKAGPGDDGARARVNH